MVRRSKGGVIGREAKGGRHREGGGREGGRK